MYLKDSYYNYLVERDTKLKLLERKHFQDSLLEIECSSAWIEMMFKVKAQPNDSEARKFWEERLNTLHKLFDERAEMMKELITLETEYKKLYMRYAEQVNVNIKLQKEFEKH